MELWLSAEFHIINEISPATEVETWLPAGVSAVMSSNNSRYLRRDPVHRRFALHFASSSHNEVLCYCQGERAAWIDILIVTLRSTYACKLWISSWGRHRAWTVFSKTSMHAVQHSSDVTAWLFRKVRNQPITKEMECGAWPWVRFTQLSLFMTPYSQVHNILFPLERRHPTELYVNTASGTGAGPEKTFAEAIIRLVITVFQCLTELKSRTGRTIIRVV